MTNDDEIQELLHKQLFKRIDINGDGFITVDELKKSLQNNCSDIDEYFNLCKEAVQLSEIQALQMADKNNDDKISPEEFINAISRQSKFASFINTVTRGLYKNQLLRSTDLNTNYKNQIKQMDANFAAVADDEEKEIFAEFDDNNDGVVNVDEFLNSMGVMDIGHSYEVLVEIYGEEMASFFADTEKREKFTRRFANFDKDKNKAMNFQEFKTYIRKQDLMDKFEEIDADKNDVLSAEEIKFAMQQNPFIDDNKVEKFLTVADTDGNGINFNKFMDACDQFYVK